MRQVMRVLATPITLLALLALTLFAGAWGWENASKPIPSRPPDPCVTTDVGGKLTTDKVTVHVLNAGTKGGMAKRVAAVMRAYGYRVVKINNSPRRVKKTTIVGYAKDDPEVRLAMMFFKDAVFQADKRPDHSVDVLVANDFKGYVENPRTSIPVSGPVCLPKPWKVTPSGEPSVVPTASSTKK